jgi:hypothetical protein
VPPNVLAELQRDIARLGFVISQIRQIEEARQKRLDQEPEMGTHAMVGCWLGSSAWALKQPTCSSMRCSRGPCVAPYAKRREQGLAGAWQCPGSPRHDPTRVALSAVSEAERGGRSPD